MDPYDSGNNDDEVNAPEPNSSSHGQGASGGGNRTSTPDQLRRILEVLRRNRQRDEHAASAHQGTALYHQPQQLFAPVPQQQGQQANVLSSLLAQNPQLITALAGLLQSGTAQQPRQATPPPPPPPPPPTVPQTMQNALIAAQLLQALQNAGIVRQAESVQATLRMQQLNQAASPVDIFSLLAQAPTSQPAAAPTLAHAASSHLHLPMNQPWSLAQHPSAAMNSMGASHHSDSSLSATNFAAARPKKEPMSPRAASRLLTTLGSTLRSKSDGYQDTSQIRDPAAVIGSKDRELSDRFPDKLHRMLQEVHDNGEDSIVSWLPHGRAFRVHKRFDFEEKVLPKYFTGQTKWGSFCRQCQLYGFLRIASGPDAGAYYHELFLRGHPNLCRYMKRVGAEKREDESGDRRRTQPPGSSDDPDFYSMRSLTQG